MKKQAIIVVDDFNKVYKDTQKYSNVYSEMSRIFQQTYGKKPTHYARAPGRANLFGSHVDCQDYGVFPFALEHDCIMAFSVEKNQKCIKISHVDDQEYPNFEFQLDPSHTPQFTNNYQKYVWAGYKAAVEEAGLKEYVGFNLLLTGQLPIAAGCSSSAALVVVSGLVALFANNLNDKVTTQEFIQSIIDNERAIGTHCGGMDQTISVLGEQGKALFIQFNPIVSEPIQLPSGIKFVICNSLSQSAKMLTLSSRFNMRIVECRMALKMLAKKLNVPAEISKKWHVLIQVQQYLKKPLSEMISVVEQCIPNKPYTLDEINTFIGENIQEYVHDIVSWEDVLKVNKYFYPFQRAVYIFSESQRVVDIKNSCQSKQLDEKQKTKMLGDLMNESHSSCSTFYDCSSPELELLTKTCRKYGALGSRLIGAGWGGCTLSIIKDENEKLFMENVTNEYYRPLIQQKIITEEDLKTSIFSTVPCNGAMIYVNKQF